MLIYSLSNRARQVNASLEECTLEALVKKKREEAAERGKAERVKEREEWMHRMFKEDCCTLEFLEEELAALDDEGVYERATKEGIELESVFVMAGCSLMPEINGEYSLCKERHEDWVRDETVWGKGQKGCDGKIEGDDGLFLFKTAIKKWNGWFISKSAASQKKRKKGILAFNPSQSAVPPSLGWQIWMEAEKQADMCR
jgi:hypothetical protein